MINLVYLCKKKLMHFNVEKYFILIIKITSGFSNSKKYVVLAQQKGWFPALPVNLEMKEKLQQAPILSLHFLMQSQTYITQLFC